MSLAFANENTRKSILARKFLHETTWKNICPENFLQYYRIKRKETGLARSTQQLIRIHVCVWVAATLR